MLLIGWLAAATAVGVRLERAVDVPPPRAREVVSALADAIDAREDLTAVIDDPVWTCESESRCIDEIRARTRTSVVVTVQLFAAITEMRIAARAHSAEGPSETVELDVPEDAWRTSIDELVRRLFPPVIVEAPIVPASEPESLHILPITLASFAAAGLAAGIGLGVESLRSRRAARVPNLDPMEFDRLADRTQTFAIATNVSYGVAGAAAIAALLLYLFDF